MARARFGSRPFRYRCERADGVGGFIVDSGEGPQPWRFIPDDPAAFAWPYSPSFPESILAAARFLGVPETKAHRLRVRRQRPAERESAIARLLEVADGEEYGRAGWAKANEVHRLRLLIFGGA